MPTTLAESTVTMRVIEQPNPAERTVMLCGNAPFNDLGGRNYTCGACGTVLITNGRRWHLKPFVFKCRCGKCNEIA